MGCSKYFSFLKSSRLVGWLVVLGLTAKSSRTGAGVVGWCDGAGQTSSAGASYNLDSVGQGPTALAAGAGGGCLDIFTLVYPFFPLSPSLWETARYRLKYCLKGPLNPKPTNQPSNWCNFIVMYYRDCGLFNLNTTLLSWFSF